MQCSLLGTHLLTEAQEANGVGHALEAAGPIQAARPGSKSQGDAVGQQDGENRQRAEELVVCHHLRNGFPSDLSHDGALPTEVLKAQAQKAVDHKSWQGKSRHGQQSWW